jgi:hypothetical protein
LFDRRKHTLDEAFAKAGQGFLDPPYIAQIGADADDHAVQPARLA